jgi:hypothetical protein
VPGLWGSGCSARTARSARIVMSHVFIMLTRLNLWGSSTWTSLLHLIISLIVTDGRTGRQTDRWWRVKQGRLTAGSLRACAFRVDTLKPLASYDCISAH